MEEQAERCRREILAIEAELRAGNPDVAGLLLGYADWHAELRLRQGEEQQRGSDRAVNAEGSPEN